MKFVRRKLFIRSSAITSAIFFLLIAWHAAHTWRTGQSGTYLHQPLASGWIAHHGCLVIQWNTISVSHPSPDDVGLRIHDKNLPDNYYSTTFFGFDFDYYKLPSAPNGGYHMTIPYWFLLLVSALPAALLARKAMGSSLGAHLCPHCRYDLHATPTRCPECGHEFPSAAIPPP